ncbi:Rtf2 RING-finger-domain-containing protein [Gymnopilus junonius]|uniref:Rtf2 RING-finger-domain-containing protein n=1 Tax=Gymnopilus junonius TaxID=109634 RepID=A0A9P5NDC4_GYMJU|nr:Rtf2 RING-finger-domain-containing protein [Gymnopilus junonius]
MGNDGGSIPDRRDLVRNKPKAEQADKANQTKARWFFCALSKRKLQEPVVSCALGKLYNKDAILEYLLNKQAYGDGERICGHIRSLKDVKTLKLTPNPVAPPPSTSTVTDDASPDIAPFVCPLTLKEMNGVQPFVYIATCGCVFSQAGLKTVAASIAPSANGNGNGNGKAKEKEKEGLSTPEEEEDTFNFNLCPQCQTKYSPKEDVIPLNPPEEDELKMRFAMERKRLAEPAASKKKSKKRKNPTTAAADSGGPSLADDKEKEKEKDNPKESGEPPAKKLHTSSSSSHQTHIHAHPSHAHKHHTHSHPSIAGSSRAVVEELAREEAKRKAGMSDAVKSLYGDGTSRRKETFMTMGTFTRYA